MSNPHDIRVLNARLHLLPVTTRVPLKFGTETLTEVTCARVCVTVENRNGDEFEGWGETPISVQWVWPSPIPYSVRYEHLITLCKTLCAEWRSFREFGHALELGADFQSKQLRKLLDKTNSSIPADERIPWLAALVCCSAFDIAVHDAYGVANARDIYECYSAEFMNRDLAQFLEPAAGTNVGFDGRHPEDFLTSDKPTQLRAWHLVGGLDWLTREDIDGDFPKDDHPVTLVDWIARDGLKCLKIKLRGNDAAWDYDRIARVGGIGVDGGIEWLSVDFNCTVTEPCYVNEILDRLCAEHPRIYGMILYVEQPFPYELEELRIDTHSVSARKPLFLDESAHDWEHVRLGRELGWTGVALKTCKTQTGAILSACWAKAHGMTLMVQDLTNPMLAQIPHVRLAAHVGTIMGVETNGMQFYPAASEIEARVHPGLYQRRSGKVDLSTLSGQGFGYRLQEIGRELPEAVGTP